MSNVELLARRNAAVPRGVASATELFAVKGENAEIWDDDGNRYLDFAAGIAVCNTGHRHPKVMKAIARQNEAFVHTAFQINPYETYVSLAERLNQLAPISKAKTIFLNSGAEAVENAVKIASINYMNSTISYLAYYMANGADEYVNTSIQTSQDLWQEVISEFNNLLSPVGLISDELPNIGNSLLPTSNIMIFVANNGTKRINVRNRPNLNADILAQFEPGMQAIGLERVESGDWLLINLDGVTGWVFTEMVTVSTDIEELPISAPFEE